VSEAEGAKVRSSNVGRFIWYELGTKDPDAAKAFYTAALGWGAQPFAMEGPMEYTVWMAGEDGVGGVMKMEEMAPHWLGYVYVGDVDAALSRATELGGRVMVPGTDIPNVGRFGIVADPQGGGVGLLQPSGEDRPHDMRAVGKIGWHELHTTDSTAAWQFYSGLFGWQPATSMDMGEDGVYSIFRHAADAEDAWLGGMDDMAGRMNSQPLWLYYVNVDRMAPTLERITTGGGKVLHGPMDVPGGKAAQCLDPQGAVFAIFAPE